MTYSGVVFDFNGTLLWDTKLHNTAWDVFLEKFGIFLTDEEKHEKIHGRMNKEILMDLFNNNLTEEQVKEYLQEKERIYRELCVKENLPLAPGAIKLFEDLKEIGIPFTIATASGIENVEFYLDYYVLSKWFNVEQIVYNDGTMRGKPYPDLFNKAISLLGMEAGNVVIFEDAPLGIQAAENAGAGRIYIVDSYNQDFSNLKNQYTKICHFDEVDRSIFIR